MAILRIKIFISLRFLRFFEISIKKCQIFLLRLFKSNDSAEKLARKCIFYFYSDKNFAESVFLEQKWAFWAEKQRFWLKKWVNFIEIGLVLSHSRHLFIFGWVPPAFFLAIVNRDSCRGCTVPKHIIKSVFSLDPLFSKCCLNLKYFGVNMLKRGNILATADIGITVFEPRLIKNDHFSPVFNHRIGCWKSFNKTTQQPHLRSGHKKVSQVYLIRTKFSI